MKNKITKLFMLLVAAASMGAFVSCKDTNEDLYNELRTELLNEINKNTTLANALEIRISQVEQQIEDLKNWKAQMEEWKKSIKSCDCPDVNSCTCPDNAGLIKDLQELIGQIQKDIEEKDKENLKQDDLIIIFNEINNILENYATIEKMNEEIERRLLILEQTLTEKIDKLEEALKNAKCGCPEDAAERLLELERFMSEAKKAIETALALAKDVEDLKNYIKDLQETIIPGINNSLDDLGGRIEKNKAEIDKEIDDIKETLKKIDKNAQDILDLNNALQGIREDLKNYATNDALSLVSQKANDAWEEAVKAKATADANSIRIDTLDQHLKNNYVNITEFQEALEGLGESINNKIQDLSDELKDELDKTNNTVDSLKTNYKTLSEEVDSLKKELKACKETCDKNLELAKAHTDYEIAELKKELMDEITENTDRITENTDSINALRERYNKDVELLKGMLEQLSNKLGDIDLSEIYQCLESLNEADSLLNGRIDANEKTIGDLQEEVEALKTSVDGLKNRIDKAEETLGELTTKIERLTGDVKAIQEYLSKQVTSIIIQGTYNPLFGSLSIPGTDIMSTSLVAFYGLPVSDVEFPTSDDANYVRKSEALTDKDMEMLGGLEVFEAPANLPLLNEGGNAGKVYVTINPSSADLTGLNLSIVNTLDEESPIKLSPIKKCEEKLQSGWTRANNGFYVAEASVTPKTVMTENGGLNINKENFSELFKETKEQFSDLAKDFDAGKLNLSELATDVYSVIRELKVDKSGLKCTYTTTDADGTEKEHSVYSQYNLAATFLNPLNLKWGKDFNYVTMPGYELADSLLNRFSNTLKDQVDVILNDVINIDGMQDFIGHFQIDELTYLGEASELISRFEARVSHIVLNGIGYQLEVPGAGAFDVKFNKNLTANGAAVSIPAEVAYDEDNVTLYRAAVVIGGDIVNGMTATLVVPARGVEDEVVAAYASILLAEESVSVTVSGNQITMTTTDGEYTLANVNGTSINTDDCTDRLILRDVAGNGGSLRLPIAVEISNDLRDLIERQGGTINDIVTQLNDMLKNINDYQGTINGWIDNGVDNFLKKYLDLINKNVVDFVNSINRRFGPFMVASNNNKGFKYLSSSKSYPTVLSADGLAIYPTTKNMELIVPLARKHVAVTNVFKGNESAQNGNADCKARLQAINGTEKLNTVIDGTVRKIDVSNMESGYTYEIAYSVLDFEGNISTQKYYVTIK